MDVAEQENFAKDNIRRFLKISTVAEKANLCTKAIRRRIADGSLKAKRVGGLWMVDADSYTQCFSK